MIGIGSVLIDEIYISKNVLLPGTSNPAELSRQVGGVITNISRHLSKLGVEVELITALGIDTDAAYLQKALAADEVKLNYAVPTSLPTGKYVGLLSPDGSLYTAVVTDTIENVITPNSLQNIANFLIESDIVIADCNLSATTLQWLIHFCRSANLKLIIEPVSVPKARKLAELDLKGVFLITPNEDELQVMTIGGFDTASSMIEQLMAKGVQHIWLRKGAAGSLFCDNQLLQIHLPAISLEVKDATGAGDAALAAWVAGFLNGDDIEKCIKAGHALAYEVLQQVGAVVEDLNESRMQVLIKKYDNEAK